MQGYVQITETNHGIPFRLNEEDSLCISIGRLDKARSVYPVKFDITDSELGIPGYYSLENVTRIFH